MESQSAAAARHKLLHPWLHSELRYNIKQWAHIHIKQHSGVRVIIQWAHIHIKQHSVVSCKEVMFNFGVLYLLKREGPLGTARLLWASHRITYSDLLKNTLSVAKGEWPNIFILCSESSAPSMRQTGREQRVWVRGREVGGFTRSGMWMWIRENGLGGSCWEKQWVETGRTPGSFTSHQL